MIIDEMIDKMIDKSIMNNVISIMVNDCNCFIVDIVIDWPRQGAKGGSRLANTQEWSKRQLHPIWMTVGEMLSINDASIVIENSKFFKLKNN